MRARRTLQQELETGIKADFHALIIPQSSEDDAAERRQRV
jgi:hypothetical protein